MERHRSTLTIEKQTFLSPQGLRTNNAFAKLCSIASEGDEALLRGFGRGRLSFTFFYPGWRVDPYPGLPKYSPFGAWIILGKYCAIYNSEIHE